MVGLLSFGWYLIILNQQAHFNFILFLLQKGLVPAKAVFIPIKVHNVLHDMQEML